MSPVACLAWILIIAGGLLVLGFASLAVVIVARSKH